MSVYFLKRWAYAASDICRDCNEAAIASAAEIFGKLQLVILAIPLFESLIDILTVILE